MRSFTPSQLRARLKNKRWIMPYNRLEAIVDVSGKKVMYIEDYGPKEGFFIEGWRALHFPLTSSIVEKSYREGNVTIYILGQGKAKLKLVPSFAPIGIEHCRVVGENTLITIAGVGGGGVSASFSRGMAEGVKKVEVLSEGGGRKFGKGRITLPSKKLLLIGVDDTDNETEGATYSLVHNIAEDIAEKLKVRYVIHVNVQLYPYNPHKTKNCFSTVVGIIFSKNSEKREIVNYFREQLKLHSLSKETAMATYEGFVFSEEFLEFCKSLKFRFLEDIDEAYKVARKNKIETFTITGRRGAIGAIGSLGYFDKPDFAAKLPSQCE